MKAASWFAIGIVTGLLAPAAMAFQETGGTGAQPAPATQGGASSPLGIDPRDPPKAAAGSEIRIPGLGKIGVLPKLDFGLELLYGANGDPRSRPED